MSEDSFSLDTTHGVFDLSVLFAINWDIHKIMT